MDNASLNLIKQLEQLKNEAISFTKQYEANTANPDIDFIANEINRMKRVVLAHTEMNSIIEQKEKAIALLCDYLNEEKFTSDQAGLQLALQAV